KVCRSLTAWIGSSRRSKSRSKARELREGQGQRAVAQIFRKFHRNASVKVGRGCARSLRETVPSAERSKRLVRLSKSADSESRVSGKQDTSVPEALRRQRSRARRPQAHEW